jgi:hypothetical protein
MGRGRSQLCGNGGSTRRKKAGAEVVIFVDFSPLCSAFGDQTGPVLHPWGSDPFSGGLLVLAVNFGSRAAYRHERGGDFQEVSGHLQSGRREARLGHYDQVQIEIKSNKFN